MSRKCRANSLNHLSSQYLCYIYARFLKSTAEYCRLISNISFSQSAMIFQLNLILITLQERATEGGVTSNEEGLRHCLGVCQCNYTQVDQDWSGWPLIQWHTHGHTGLVDCFILSADKC